MQRKQINKAFQVVEQTTRVVLNNSKQAELTDSINLQVMNYRCASLTSLMVLTISSSAEVWKLYPSFLSSSLRYRVTSRPATSDLIMLCGMAKPSYIGTAWVTPSPESNTTPVVFPVAYLGGINRDKN